KSSAGFARLDPGEAYLVIEVAVSSLAYDKGLKARLYARHASESFGSSTPTRASRGFTPARAATNGRRSSNAGRKTRSPPRRCLASRSDSPRSTDEYCGTRASNQIDWNPL